jgi:microcystin-dependent protein
MGVLRARVNGAWVDLTVGAPGPPGPAGPSGITTVSSDAGNDLTTGTDGRIFYDDATHVQGKVPIYATEAARDAAITAPIEGQQSYTQDTNTYWSWNGTAWVPVSSTPTGTVTMFGGTSAPVGWFLCQGQTLTTATYPTLFAVIAYNFGGSGPNFMLPDLRGRSPIGVGPSGQGNNYALGQAWGNESEALSVAQMPTHSHGGATVGMDRAQAHNHRGWGGLSIVHAGGGITGIGGLSGSGTQVGQPSTDNTNIDHLHGIYGEGGGQGHNTVHPVRGIHFIIKT